MVKNGWNPISLPREKVLNIKPSLTAYPFPKRQISDSPKLKEFADDKFEFDENGRNLSK